MPTNLLPLSHSAQEKLEQTKAEIVKVHGQRDYPAEVQKVEKTAIDSAIAQTINETESLHNMVAGVKNYVDVLLERYVTTEEAVEEVTGRLGVVEGRYEEVERMVRKGLVVLERQLGKLEVAVKSDRAERLETINHNAWAFNNQASDKHDELRPLKAETSHRNLNSSPEASPYFPLSVSRVGKLSVSELRDLLCFYNIVVYRDCAVSSPEESGDETRDCVHSYIMETDSILPLNHVLYVQNNLDICRRAFVRHIGLKWEVVEKLKLFRH
ncbi:hypothetical protein TWF192_006592 [Orbilia oligospora]|uniref:Uncharacterized protein n=1 Tax=Orbilia oligospora TaxID=2813651 RepID=A0A6G1M6B5_ORBOL|nr:hypothetical protein TWF191_000909 [Orbilia oligospora]KAF3247347.1 hypothetical protein TWF192_006592 [Orbilia oligospora]